jgi:hypothetical protein
MRPAALVGLAALLAVSSARAADPTPYCAVVSDVEVKLRAGPGDGFPDTGTLPKGSYVIVEREENGGWLAVTAPYGSVSWIATQFIEDPAPDRLTPKNVIVHVDDEVTLAAGKVGEAQPLDIRRVKVPNGTRLVLLGPKVTFAGKTWYPVSPPAGDVRYLPKTAVRYDKPAPNNFSVRVIENTSPPPGAASPAAPATPAGGPLATVPGPGSTPAPAGGVVASKPAVNHPLWTQAETAEREGRFADAEKAYFDLAALMNGQGGDHDIANLCYTRIHALREKKRNARGPAASGTSGRPSVLQPPSKDERGVRAGAPQALPPVTPTNSNTGTSPPANGGKWTGPGTLRRSVLTPDGTGKPAYALEVAPGVVKAYVVAGPGVELDKLIGQRVDVYGVSKTISGLSKPFIVATAVEQVQ